ncbi:nuclear transport factor 2 family protein [Lacticigenium naphthae]|uniref:nuclear transport factor 2 family protein n=1 Tax=Lacticigenium naphthae TaxID=515351 RepID=UPI000413DBEB|nr:nuclear transport factor 2 family protein [Lacticigenium naphthae]
MGRDSLQNKIMSIEEIKELWSKTYSADGKPDWSHIFPFYHENIIFQDSIQRIEGKVEFEAMCNRLAKRCKSLRMDIYTIIKADNSVMMEWKMTMSFRVFPTKPIYGATRLTFDSDGLIIEQRDYYDLWGDICDGIPVVRSIYRWLMRVFFG